MEPLKNYIRFLRKQHSSIQHAHAFLFAFTITMIFVVLTLYYDYGFFRTTYNRSEEVADVVVPENKMESPFSAFINIFKNTGKMFSEANASTTASSTFNTNTINIPTASTSSVITASSSGE